MNERIPQARWQIQHKLILSHVAVAMLTLLLAGSLTGIAASLLPRGLGRLLLVGGTLVVAGLASVVLSAGATYRLGQRLRQRLRVIQAWLRGNLTARIADPHRDDLGLMAEYLDQLAAHLQESEEDLAELRERNARLTDQVRALAVVEERNRLARELHDSVKQHLFSLTLTTSALQARLAAETQPLPPDVQEMLREIESAAQTAQHETTRLIEDLRPGTLEELGLAQSLNDYTLLFGAQEHLLIYLDVEGDTGDLPPSFVEALYRVTQEALHNVARHARATRVDVGLRCTADRVTLRIADNGMGFEIDALRQGLGISNMQERLLAVGGKLSIDSQPGRGTTIIAQIERRGDEADRAELHPAQRPIPRPENWAWLGQRLVIPVGQTWPWPPAELPHLRHPLILPDSDPIFINATLGLLGLRHGYALSENGRPLLHLRAGFSGYDWTLNGEAWGLRHVRGRGGRMVLTRKGQALAAMQYRGRQVHKWSEIIYDGRGYRLATAGWDTHTFTLTDERGALLLEVTREQVTLWRELPLQLLAMVVARAMDEFAVAGNRPA